MKKKFDVLGIGTVAVDELILAENYPAPDTKTRVLRVEKQCGGLTAIPLMTASRLGAKCAYAGMLGDDELSRFALQQLRVEKINLKFLCRRNNARPVHSYVIIDAQKKTRNIFSHREGVSGPAKNWPTEEVIRASKILYVDHHGEEGMIRAARLARKHGVAVVADFERISGPRFGELIELVDHLILSQAFARKWTGQSSVEKAAKKLWTNSRKLVAITCGTKGAWYLADDGRKKMKHQPIFDVNVMDTTGCGDVFHGGYVAALAEGMPREERIRFATAASALKAMKMGAQAGIPHRAEVERFLKTR